MPISPRPPKAIMTSSSPPLDFDADLPPLEAVFLGLLFIGSRHHACWRLG